MVDMVSKEVIIEKLKEVIDPHTSENVYEMGLITEIEVDNDEVKMTFVPSSKFCPIGSQLAVAIKRKVKTIDELKNVDLIVDGFVDQDKVNTLLQDV